MTTGASKEEGNSGGDSARLRGDFPAWGKDVAYGVPRLDASLMKCVQKTLNDFDVLKALLYNF